MICRIMISYNHWTHVYISRLSTLTYYFINYFFIRFICKYNNTLYFLPISIYAIRLKTFARTLKNLRFVL